MKGVFIPKILNKQLASCSLINFDFLLSHTAHLDKSIILQFYVLATFGFLLSVFFVHFKKYDNISYKQTKIFNKRDYVFILWISSFILLYSFRTLFIKTNPS